MTLRSHACAPSPAVALQLRRGMRSSVVEVCTCVRASTWIQRATDGAIVAMAEGKDGR